MVSARSSARAVDRCHPCPAHPLSFPSALPYASELAKSSVTAAHPCQPSSFLLYASELKCAHPYLDCAARGVSLGVPAGVGAGVKDPVSFVTIEFPQVLKPRMPCPALAWRSPRSLSKLKGRLKYLREQDKRGGDHVL